MVTSRGQEFLNWEVGMVRVEDNEGHSAEIVVD